MRVMHLEDTVGAACSEPGCNCSSELYMHGRCHMDEKTTATLGYGELIVRCGLCNTDIVTFAVSSQEQNVFNDVWVRLKHGTLAIIGQADEELDSFRLLSRNRN